MNKKSSSAILFFLFGAALVFGATEKHASTARSNVEVAGCVGSVCQPPGNSISTTNAVKVAGCVGSVCQPPGKYGCVGLACQPPGKSIGTTNAVEVAGCVGSVCQPPGKAIGTTDAIKVAFEALA